MVEPTLPVLLLLVWALLALDAAPALARTGPKGPRRLAVLGLDAVELSPKLAVGATRAIRKRVSRVADLVLVARDAVTLSEASLTFACIDEAPGCLAGVGRDLGAQLLVYGKLRPYDGKVHAVLHLLDVEREELLSSKDGVFPRSKVTRGAASLFEALLSSQGPLGTRGRLALTVMQAGARIYVDGRLVDQAPLSGALPLAPGRHELKILLQGFREDSRQLEVRPGQTVELTIDLAPLPETFGSATAAVPAERLPAEAPALPADDRPPSSAEQGLSTSELFGWGLLGGGLLTAGAGGVFGMLVLDAQSQFDATTYQRRAHELADSGEQRAFTANVLYGVGGALAAAGVILLLTGSGDSPDGSGAAGLTLLPTLPPLGAASNDAWGISLSLSLP